MTVEITTSKFSHFENVTRIEICTEKFNSGSSTSDKAFISNDSWSVKHLNSSGDIGCRCSLPQMVSIFSESLLSSLIFAEELLYMNCKHLKNLPWIPIFECFCVINKAWLKPFLAFFTYLSTQIVRVKIWSEVLLLIRLDCSWWVSKETSQFWL